MDKLKTTIKNYGLQHLDESNIDPDPIKQFQIWLQEAFEKEPREPNAMTLATVDSRGQPSARLVLLKGVNAKGFNFFTNYNSRKSQELSINPHVALVFWWPYCERQVRVEGLVTLLSSVESDAYFASRSKESKLGALASNQSTKVKNRQVIDVRYKELAQQYATTENIPRPAYWGGYCVIPAAIEFWQGGSHRLHDRIRYERRKNEEWEFFRLAP